MSGIVISIDPYIMRLGFFELRWYGLAIIVAVIAAVLITARQMKIKGIPLQEIQSLAPWMGLGAVMGARLFHVVDIVAFFAFHLFEQGVDLGF